MARLDRVDYAAIFGPTAGDQIRLGDTDLGFDVPGRRLDGTVKGKRLVRRFFWNVFRGIGGAFVYVFALLNGAGSGGGKGGHPFQREIRVT